MKVLLNKKVLLILFLETLVNCIHVDRIPVAQRLSDGSGYPAEILCVGLWRINSGQPGHKAGYALKITTPIP